MNSKSRALLRSYQAALRRYLKQGPAAGLQTAARLGRRAVVLGVETLDLALIHEQALIALALPIRSSAARVLMVKRAGAFFAEAIVPIEKTHRTAMSANLHLSQLNRALSQRASELSTSNRRLKKEISRRLVVERNLRQSDERSTRLLEESRHLQDRLHHLSRRVLSAQEDERKRISRELHDVIAQTLTGINVRLASLRTEAAGNTKGIMRSIARTQRLVVKSVDAVHRFARELRPTMLDDLGLVPALHAYMKGFARETGLQVSLTACAGLERLDSARRTAFFRVAQEALTNVARHAHAGRVDVSIRGVRGAVKMQIKDDGTAFDVDQMWHTRKRQHLGLLGMRERVEMIGGTFAVESAPGCGTIVNARIPINGVVMEHHRP